MSRNVDASAESIEYLGETKARNPYLAVALTFLCPGLGYMYVGQILKGVTINLLFLLMLETFVIVFSILKFFPLLPLLVFAVAWGVFSGFAAHGVLAHCRDSEHYVLKGYNHWTIYAIAFLMTFAVPVYATMHFIAEYLLGFERVQTSAMYPTIHDDDVVLIDLSAYRNRVPKRGDLVAVTPPGEHRSVVLRVVAVENDVVRIEGETVFVNNEPLERLQLTNSRVPSMDGEGDLLAMVENNNGQAYVISVSPKAFSSHSMPPKKLAAHQLFVLADNRSQIDKDAKTRIRDSRDFGPVRLENIEGEPLYIAWSRQDGRTRWDRIGLRTQ